jgi:5-methylcytosine-specific restriction endonuclease McrA
MSDALARGVVWRRAQDRCEYCRLPQCAIEATFHVEHILARQHSPPDADAPDNLALACHHCNLHKGTNLTSIDPISGLVVPLFHPRRDNWNEHFALREAHIVGITPTGRVTVQLLQFNTERRLELREALIADGKF